MTTYAGRRLLEREMFNSRSFPIVTPEAVAEIEAEARAALLAECGCACPCHVDEGKPEWPGSCAGCCDRELDRYGCKCAAYMRGYEKARAALLAELEAGLAGLDGYDALWDGGDLVSRAAVLELIRKAGDR